MRVAGFGLRASRFAVDPESREPHTLLVTLNP